MNKDIGPTADGDGSADSGNHTAAAVSDEIVGLTAAERSVIRMMRQQRGGTGEEDEQE